MKKYKNEICWTGVDLTRMMTGWRVSAEWQIVASRAVEGVVLTWCFCLVLEKRDEKKL